MNFLLLLFCSGQEVDCKDDGNYWYRESTSAASSVNASEYNSDDGFIDIEDESFKTSHFPVSQAVFQPCICKLLFIKNMKWMKT